MSGCKRKGRDDDFLDVDDEPNPELIRVGNTANSGAFATNNLGGSLDAVRSQLKIVCKGVEKIADEVTKMIEYTKRVDNGEAGMHAQITSLLEDVKSKDESIEELKTKLESAKKKEESFHHALIRLSKVHDDVSKNLASLK